MEILNKNLNIARQVYTKELNLNEFKQNFKTLQDAEAEIKEELKGKTVKVLKSAMAQLGMWHDSRDKKSDLIDKIYNRLRVYFYLGRGVSFMYGEKTYEQAEAELIESVSEEDLKAFYDKRRQEKAEQEKAISNPQTIKEYNEFIRIKGKESLTSEQLTHFEELKASRMLEQQKKRDEEQNKVNQVNIKNADFELHPTKHSKTGEDIFTVVMTERVDKETFNELRTKSKKFGGYYSRYTDKYANPPIKAGFNFKTEEDAKSFMGLKDGDQDTTERKEKENKVKEVSTSEKLRDRANKVIQKAEESLNQDRTTNTARQARMASSAEGKARAEIIFGKKLLAIADALESGQIKYLHALSNGKQLEQLELILRRGFNSRLSSLNLSYTEREKEEPNPLEDVNFIRYPYPQYGANVISNVFLPYINTDGLKRNVKEILDIAKRNQDERELVELKSDYQIKLFKKAALKLDDKWQRERILENIKDYERLQKMGITNEVILKVALRELAELGKGAKLTESQKKQMELKALERKFIGKKIAGFFPTPDKVIDKMFSMAKVFENETILEPSAGLGHIAEQIRLKYPNNSLDVVEFNYQLWEALTAKGFNAEHINFLATSHKYDVIFMNPPFENHQDIDHVRHAFKLLNPGGRLVAVMAGGRSNENSSQSKVKEFQEFVNSNGGYFDDNEEGSFKSAFNSTGVSTTTVYIEKKS